MVPSVPTPGNHEQAQRAGRQALRALSHHWRPQFTLPENGPAGLEETVLHARLPGRADHRRSTSNERIDEQVPWLERCWPRTSQPLDRLHVPPPGLLDGQGARQPRLRDAWKPMSRQVQASTSSSRATTTATAAPARTPSLPENVGNVPTGVNKVDGKTGTVYVVSVSGPKMYDLERTAVHDARGRGHAALSDHPHRRRHAAVRSPHGRRRGLRRLHAQANAPARSTS